MLVEANGDEAKVDVESLKVQMEVKVKGFTSASRAGSRLLRGRMNISNKVAKITPISVLPSFSLYSSPSLP